MTDISAWAAVDDSNLNPSPAGWPEGMMPSGVNNSARAMMGGLKRWRDQLGGTIIATGTGNAVVITYPVPPAPLAQGDVFTYYHALANTGAATLQVNAQAAKPICNAVGSALTGGEMPANGMQTVAYDGTIFRLANASTAAAVGAVNKAGDTMTGALTAPAVTSTGTVAATLDVTAGRNLSVAGTSFLNATNTGTLSVTGNAAVSGQVQCNATQWPTYGIASPAANLGFVYSYATAYLWVAPNGAIAGPIAVNISDERLKRDIRPVTVDPLASLGRVQLKAFNQIAPGQDGVRSRDVGFIAQQLREIIPDAVIEPPPEMENAYLGLDLMPLVAYCVGAIQQLAARVEQLETALVR